MSRFISWASECPIAEDYSRFQVDVSFLEENAQVARLTSSLELVGYNAYFVSGLDGARETIFLRKGVLLKLEEAVEKLSPDLSFYVFDAFRSKRTQWALFRQMQELIAQNNPSLRGEALIEETKKYAAHPEDTQRFPVPPHNTGGAIDLGLCNRLTGELLNFGNVFDDPTEKSDTAFFEKDFRPEYGIPESEWLEIRRNRRILFHVMMEAGFTNYEHEWWHYDLGDWVWAKKTGQPSIYGSMEDEVGRLSSPES